MRRDARGWRPRSSERDGGKTGSAAQNLPRFSSTATTVPGDLRADWPLALPEDLSGLPEGLPDFPTGLPDFPTGLPDFPTGLPDFPTGLPDFPTGLPDLPAACFPLDLRGALT
jgi:hypothetical protein